MNRSNGISLIILVITIIVIVILAGSVILSISQNNPIKAAEEARFKQKVSNYKTELGAFLQKEYVDSNGALNISQVNASKVDQYSGLTIQGIIPSMNDDDANIFEIKNGNLVYIGESVDEIQWAANIGVTASNATGSAPTVSFTNNGDTGVNDANTGILISDSGTGINENATYYYWDTQNFTSPSSGWTQYNSGSTITKTGITENWYLWIKAADTLGNVSYTVSNVFKGVPPTYTLLDYIQSDGFQYIDTGLKPVNHSTEIKYQYIQDVSNNAIFGTTNGTYLSPSGGSYHLTRFNSNWYWLCGNTEYNYSGLGTLDVQTVKFNTASPNGYIYQNDVQKATNCTTTPLELNYNLLLFGRRGSDGPGLLSKAKIYYAIITNKSTGLAERYFKPVQRKSDNVCGLYDFVNDVFYTNSGTKAFAPGYITAVMPDGYTRANYVESNKTQYIDTGIIPINHTTEITFKFNSTAGNPYLGGTYNDSTNCFYLPFIVDSNYSRFIGFNENFGTAGSTAVYSGHDINTHHLVFNDSSGKTYFDNNLTSLLGGYSTAESSFANYTMWLFARNGPATGYYMSGRIYYCKITNKSTGLVVREFVPVKRTSDSRYGLYDLVNNVFYQSTGTLAGG